MNNLLPTTDFFGKNVTRLIVGGNPFSGNSHINQDVDEDIRDYYSTKNI